MSGGCGLLTLEQVVVREPVYWIITSGLGVATLKRVPTHEEAGAAVK